MNNSDKIETRRLILRLFNQDDFSFFLKILKDNLVSTNLTYFINKKDLGNPKYLFYSIIQSLKTPNPILLFTIIRKDTEDCIGSCGLKLLSNNDEAICFYLLLPFYRGFGYAIEAMKKLIEYSFSKLHLSKLITYIDPKSSEIWKVAERVGMKYLGQVPLNKLHSKAMYFSIDRKEFDHQQII